MEWFVGALFVVGLGYLQYQQLRRRYAKARAAAASQSPSEQRTNLLIVGLMISVSSVILLAVDRKSGIELATALVGLVGGAALIYKASTIKVGAVDKANAVAARVGIADEIAKLAAMRDEGILADEEFAQLKAGLLDAAKQTPASTADVSAPTSERIGEPEGALPQLPSSLRPLLEDLDRACAQWADPDDPFYGDESVGAEDRILASLNPFMAGALAAGIARPALVSRLRARYPQVAQRPFFEQVLEG